MGIEWTGWLGVGVVAAAIGVAAFGVLALRGQPRGRTGIEGLAQVLLIPERRRRYFQTIIFEGIAFTLAALAWGFDSLGVLPPAVADLLIPLCFLGGSISMAWMTFVGMRPRPLSREEQSALETNGRALIYSLAFAPVDVRSPPPPPF
ncbi:MAG TPA: hypothetical protein VFG07_06870 [Thermoplasmata archaeon]|nr:hypothetical protein [Thermoplasmata archaeon]